MKAQFISSMILMAALGVLSTQAENDQAADQVATMAALLGHEQFKVREKASDYLSRMLKADPKVAGLLQKYQKHDDPEVRMRINRLLQDMRDMADKGDIKNVLKWIDPAGEKKVRSKDKEKSDHEIKLAIYNKSEQAIKIFTMCSHKHKKEGGGNRKEHVKKLDPGKHHICKDAWEKRYYVLTDMNNKALGLYLTGNEDGKIVFKGALDK